MVKLVFCLRRRPDWSRDEFLRYWRERHAPLVRRHAERLRVVRYVQLHPYDERIDEALRSVRGGPEGFDGVAELWWRSTDDFVAASQGEAGRAAAAELIEDERVFIDLERSPLWMVEEHVVVPGPDDG